MKKIIGIIALILAIVLLIVWVKKVKTNDEKTYLKKSFKAEKIYDSIPFYKVDSTSIVNFEFPKINDVECIITHTGYSFLYDENYEQATWVAYELTKDETDKNYNRTDKFTPDIAVKTGTANNQDYAGSGYDRGHLAPAADMSWSLIAMGESFYYSNISPQVPSFNRGIWKKLEKLVRTWAIENEVVYVVTGPVLTPNLPTIGVNNVAVPKYFYKVILDYKAPEIKGIGFIIPNMGSKELVQYFAVSIDSVQKVTGINFFPLLPDSQEEMIEKTVCIPCWSWGN